MRSGADVLGLQQTAAKRINAGVGLRPKATAPTQTQAHVSDGFDRSA